MRHSFALAMAFLMLTNFTASFGQSSGTHRLGLGLFGTRKSIVNYVDYGFKYQLFSVELAFGYELGRLLQYRHLAPSLGFGTGYSIVSQEKIHLDLKSNFLCQRNQYPSNSSLVSRSMYVGYELKIGKKIQFSQRLALGIMHNEALSGYNKLSHDFMISAGINYMFLRN